MEIRIAETPELPLLANLFDHYRQFYGQVPDLDGARSFMQQRLFVGDSVILVAAHDETLIGFVQLYPSFSSVSMQRIYILNDLFVGPNFRKQGVGRSLIQAAERFGRDQNAVRLTLATAVTNEAARALYESLGWVEDDKFIHYNTNLPTAGISG